jgi:hypothetical protein
MIPVIDYDIFSITSIFSYNSLKSSTYIIFYCLLTICLAMYPPIVHAINPTVLFITVMTTKQVNIASMPNLSLYMYSMQQISSSSLCLFLTNLLIFSFLFPLDSIDTYALIKCQRLVLSLSTSTSLTCYYVTVYNFLGGSLKNIWSSSSSADPEELLASSLRA